MNRCSEIMRDVLQNSEQYVQLMGRCRLSINTREMGSFWIELGEQHSSRECADMVERLLPFWCWHKAYTLRFAQCWCEEFGESDKTDTSKCDFGFSEDCLLEAAESMQTHRRTPLQALRQSGISAVTADALLSRNCVPSRRRAAVRMLQTMVLKVNA